MKKKGYWDTEAGLAEIRNLANECSTKTEFRNKYDSAYQAAHKLGLLAEICSHMKVVRTPRGFWNSESGKAEITKLARECSKRSEFEKKHPKAYEAARKQRILDTVCKHMKSPQRESGYWKSKRGLEQIIGAAKKCKTKKEFRHRFPNEENAVRKHFNIDEICPHLVNVAHPPNFWDTPEGLAEMKKCISSCKTLNEFRKNFSRAYNTAKKKGILDEIAESLARDRQKKGFWESLEGLEEIKKIALGYNSRADFKYDHPELYIAARRAKKLDEICAHMEYAGLGFDSTSPAILYVLEVTSVIHGYTLTKIGITNHPLERRFQGEKATISAIAVWAFEFGGNARDAETNLKRLFQSKRYKGDINILSTAGNTELYEDIPDYFLPKIADIAESYGGVICEDTNF